MSVARLLIDLPLPGHLNMARDEALLTACTGSDTPPTLRFYAWSPATISLGYFQSVDEHRTVPAPAGQLPIVRRTTGGGAILHDLEVTYSLIIPLTHPLVHGRPNRLYELAHRAIIAAIGPAARFFGEADSGDICDASAQRGPFFCFARRHALDVVVAMNGAPGGFSKLAGSAQRRTATAILQHGSIILDSRYDQQPAATWREAGDVGDFDEAVRRLVPRFEEQLRLTCERDDWRDAELAAAVPFERMYASDEWTIDRERSATA